MQRKKYHHTRHLRDKRLPSKKKKITIAMQHVHYKGSKRACTLLATMKKVIQNSTPSFQFMWQMEESATVRMHNFFIFYFF